MIFYFYHLLRKINKNHQFCSSWERIFQKKSRFAGRGLTVEASTSSSRDTQREILSPARISHCFPARGLRAPVVVPYFATRVYGHRSGLSLLPLESFMASAAEGEELLGLGRKAGNHGKVSFSRVSFLLGWEKGKFEIFKRFSTRARCF